MSKSEEFNVVIPDSIIKKKFNIMKFNSGGQTDVQVKFVFLVRICCNNSLKLYMKRL